MGFDSSKKFNEPLFKEDSVEVKKLIIIAFEGAKTEYRYFSYLKNNFDLKSIVEVELLKRDKDKEHHSEPDQVAETLTDLIDNPESLDKIKSKYRNFTHDYNDTFWIIIDREKVEERKNKIKETLNICNKYNIEIILTNPNFEFWLLLHFNVDDYNNDDLFENKKISNTGKNFIERKLVEQLGSYKKSRYQTKFITNESIKLALEQEKNFETELDKIIDNLGSNVGDLIVEILKI